MTPTRSRSSRPRRTLRSLVFRKLEQISEGRLTLIDEVHPPDSSRLWRLATLAPRRRAGLEPENLDKEVVRLAYAARGYRGQGPPEPLSAALAAETAAVYRQAFEALTGSPLTPAAEPAEPRIVAAVHRWAGPRGASHSAR